MIKSIINLPNATVTSATKAIEDDILLLPVNVAARRIQFSRRSYSAADNDELRSCNANVLGAELVQSRRASINDALLLILGDLVPGERTKGENKLPLEI